MGASPVFTSGHCFLPVGIELSAVRGCNLRRKNPLDFDQVFNLLLIGPKASAQPGTKSRADSGQLFRWIGKPQRSAWNCKRESLAAAPPSTRKTSGEDLVTRIMVWITSLTWKAMPSRTLCQINSGSSSTQPGWGKLCGKARWCLKTNSPLALTNKSVVPEVPWSIPRI